jgi:phosphatidylglycerol:prolipoprotein diacylglycerol transferase
LVGNVKMYWYGFSIALGFVAALGLMRLLCKSRRLDPAPFMELAFVAIVSGVVGARILYVLTEPAEFLEHPSSIFDFWSGGLAFYGGFILATLGCILFALWKKMPMWLGADIIMTGVCFAHAFGRIGCFVAGCCHGNYCPYPWGVHNNTAFVSTALEGQPLHPVQLYESFSLFVLAGLLAWMIHKRKARPGIPAMIYLTGYAAIRFVLESWRGDEDRGVVLGGALSTSQGIAVLLFVVGCGTLVDRVWRHKRVPFSKPLVTKMSREASCKRLGSSVDGERVP